MTPTISIALCTCNGARWLATQLDSILAQTRQPDEIVVRDDASEDETMEILEQYVAKHPHLFRLIKTPGRLGAIENFRQVMLACKGTYLFLADQDDYWLPGKIARIMEIFEQNPYYQGLASDAWLTDDMGKPTGQTLWEQLHFDPDLSFPSLPYRLLVYSNAFSGATMAFRRDAILHWIQQPIPYGIYHDYWLAFALSIQNNLYIESKALIHYRIHPAQKIGLSGHRLEKEAAQWKPAEKCSGIASALHRLNDWRQAAGFSDGALLAIENLEQTLLRDLDTAKHAYLQERPWPARKWKLLKHRLRGGEYLRISWKDVWYL
jgi:glycosyltransferase involved in cell wall biosynthesis